MARRFINRLNSRWKPLERLVSEYNAEVAEPVFQGRLSPLSLRALKEDGIGDHDGEIWDVERLMCNSDWAVHKFVRVGIEAQHRIKRANEEKATLVLHIHRVCRWAVRQAEVLLQILEEWPANSARMGCTREWLELVLFSRFRTVQSMLDRANSFSLEIQEHEQLLAIERRIRTVLVAVRVDGVEGEGVGEGEGGRGEGRDRVGDRGGNEDDNGDEDEDEDEDEDDIAQEEMGEVVMCALAEELQNEAAEEVEVEL
jgi:hypothetical protein